jgi:hypothetical protein
MKGYTFLQEEIKTKRSKNLLIILKEIFFSRTSRPISIKLSTNHPSVKGIQNCSIKG